MDTNVQFGSRYERLEQISWWDQRLLGDARVLVAGAGALGNEILKNLALLGVGHILVVDFDHVEISNLSRSVLFRTTDLGRPKSTAAAESVRQINNEVEVVSLKLNIQHGLGLGVVRRMDLVLAGLDSVGARIALNRLCRRTGRPWIDGALHELDGLVRFFHPDEGACYECALSSEDYARESRRYSCQLLPRETFSVNAIPTSPTVASTIAAWQVQEAVKWVHARPVLRSEMVTFFGDTFETHRIRLLPGETCLGHDSPFNDVIQLEEATSAMPVKALLDLIEHQFGAGSFLELRVEIACDFVCPRCLVRTPSYRPVHALQAQESACSKCGTDRTVRLSHHLDRGWPEPGLSLNELGIPPLDIIAVHTKQGETLHIELSGDSRSPVWGRLFRSESNARLQCNTHSAITK